MPLELVNQLPYNHPYRWDGTLFGGPKLWRPTEITTALWLDAEDTSTITLNGATVSQWADKSGNGRNAVQATAANQPTTGTRTINSRNALDFDGADDRLTNTTLFVPQPHSVFGVVQDDISSGFRVWWTGDSNAARALIYNTSANERVLWAGVSNVANGTATNNPELWGAEFNGASSKLYINGTGGAAGNSGPNSINGYWVGAENSSPSNKWNGLIGEVIVVGSVLSTDNRQKLEGYLAWKWGLQSNLPVGHPYKNTPPIV